MEKSREFEFYVKADLSEYAGKYVAVVGRRYQQMIF